MSVEVMSIVFKAKLPNIILAGRDRRVTAPTLKLILLALGDHANDEGEGAYPSVARIEKKTALKHQSVINALKALKQEGFILKAGMSKRATVNYSLNLPMLKSLVNQVDSLRQPSLPGVLPPVYQVDPPSQPGLPEPSYNHPLIQQKEDIQNKKLLMSQLEGAARSVFPDPQGWRSLEKELEKPVVEMCVDDHHFMISGLRLNAAIFQDRYARSFSRALEGIYNKEIEVVFNE